MPLNSQWECPLYRQISRFSEQLTNHVERIQELHLQIPDTARFGTISSPICTLLA